MTDMLYALYQETLQPELTPVCWQLLTILLNYAQPDGKDTGISLADKSTVLAELATQEGTAPNATTIRKRLQRINQAVRENIPADSPAWLKLTSTKQAFKLERNQQAVQRVQRQILLTQTSADSVREVPANTTEPAIQLPQYRVFISHAWTDSDQIEGYLKEFVDQLQNSCDHLPKPWNTKFIITLWFDRHAMRGNLNRMEDQYLPAAQDSDFALFMVSDKWCHSQSCQHEAQQFRDRSDLNNQPPYCVIQLIDAHDDLDKPYRAMPNYPKFKCEFKDYANLTQLWEQAGEATKNDFVREIRQQICHYFYHVQPTPRQTTSTKALSLRDFASRQWPSNLDIAPHKAIKTQIQSHKGDDSTAADIIPAVPTLFDWACTAQPEQRTTVLLGGFGMGKTVTMQLLADKLHKDRQQNNKIPTPVYLDLRNLLPQTEHGKPVTLGIDELILTALDPEKTTQQQAGQLREMIQTEPCVVIFDGLDEIGNRIGRDHAVKLYRQFLQIIPSSVRQAEAQSKTVDFHTCPTRLILTCRTHFFRDLREQAGFFAGAHRSQNGSNRYQVYHMAPLSLDKIQELFVMHLGAEQGAQAFELIQQIHDLPGLAARPIMARFITETADQLIQRHQQDLPINIASVYDGLFQSGIERDQEKDPLLTKRDRKQILIALAAHLQQQALQYLPADDLEDWFDTFAHTHAGIRHILSAPGINTRNLLHTELENASFLVRDSADKFRFAHTSFFEYFLAEALLQALPDHSRLAALSQHPISRETRQFVQAVAQHNDTQAALQNDINQVLCAEAAAEARLFCLRMQQQLHPKHTLPTGANLSGLDLCGLDTTGTDTPLIWQQVNLADAQLNRWQAEQIHFRQCHFQHTQLANATFDHCTFIDCNGLPQGLASARGAGTALPASWQQQLTSACPAAQQHWQDIPLGQVINIPTTTRFTSVIYSPDGCTALSGSYDGTLRLWDLTTGAEMLCLKGHTDSVTSVAYGPDGRTALSGSVDGTVRQWDLTTGSERCCLKGHTDSVNSVAVGPDGHTALSGGADGTVRLWDLTTRAEMRRLTSHAGSVNSVAYGLGDRTALSGGVDCTIRLWNLKIGIEIHCIKKHSAPVTSVATSPDGRTGLSSGKDGAVRLWNLKIGIEIHCIKECSTPVTDVAFSSDGHSAIISNWYGTVQLWDLTTGAETHYRLTRHTEPVNSMAFSPDGQSALSVDYDDTVRQWDLPTGAEICCLTHHTSWMISMALNSNGQITFSGKHDGTVQLWDLAANDAILCLKGHVNPATCAVYGMDGHIALSGGGDSTVRLWDLTTGIEIGCLTGHTAWVTSVAHSPDGRTALSASHDGTVRRWDLTTRTELRCCKGHTDWVFNVAFCPDGNTALSGSRDRTVRLWDLVTGAEIRCLQGHTNGVLSVAVSSDGRTALSGSYDGTVRLWDLVTGAEVRCFKGHTGWVTNVAVSPDGQSALSGSQDGTVRQWDLTTGAEMRCLQGHTDSVLSVAFSPDGRTALSGSHDGTVRQWDLATGALRTIHYVLPDAWATCDAQHRLLNQGGKLWKYASLPVAYPASN